MKGIILISNDQKSGSYINIQYPSLLCDVEEIDPSELLNLYEEQANKNLGPSYFETKIKNGIKIAFFFSGFSQSHYVGKPGHALLVFISKDDTIIDNLEGMMRRMVYELLPQKEEATFYALFQDYYELLKNGELGPYWEEVGEKEVQEVGNHVENEKIPLNEDVKKQDKPQDNNNEIKNLKKHIWEQEEKLAHWREELANLNDYNASLMNKLKISKEESDKQKETIQNQENEIDELKQLYEQAKKKIDEMKQQVNNISELQAIADKSREQSIEIEKKDKEIKTLQEKLVQDVEKKEAEISTLQEEFDANKNDIDLLRNENKNLKSDIVYAEEEIDKLKNENERFLGTFTNLKLENKQLRDKLEGQNKNNEKLKDEIIEMKKEVKVLRRERDHYKKIVKEKNLL